MPELKYPHSLLYKISGGELTKPSWLLGTMHMICAKDFAIKKKVLSALKKCTHYYMEVDLGSQSELETMQHQEATLAGMAEDLSDKGRAELEEILSTRFGINMEEAADLPPMALINKMAAEAIGCEEIAVAEMELLAIASARGIVTGGLETAKQQLEIASKVFTGKEMLLQMRSSDDYKDLFGKMRDAYQTEKLTELAGFVTDKRMMSRRAYNILVIDRNKRWARLIPKIVTKQSSFIAVGAGHLPGEKGVINLLRQQRLNVNPVYR